MEQLLCSMLLATFAVWPVASQCSKEHAKVGLTADLSTLQHDVEGTVEVVDECSFRVKNFKYDGTGPDVFWYGSDVESNLASGHIMDSIPSSHGPWDGSEEVLIELPDGVTWDDINVLSVWCRAFGIDFGNAVLPEPEAKETDSMEVPKDIEKSNELEEATSEIPSTETVDVAKLDATEADKTMKTTNATTVDMVQLTSGGMHSGPLLFSLGLIGIGFPIFLGMI